MLHLVCVSVVERFANKGVEATVPHVNAKIADGVLTPHSFSLLTSCTLLLELRQISWTDCIWCFAPKNLVLSNWPAIGAR